MPLSTAEKKVKDYLDRSPHDVTVADIVRQFTKVPYEWADSCTIYVVNELVRRHLYAFNYNNTPNVSREDVARNIVKESNRFTVETAKAISQDILNEFIEAWKHIFNVVTVKGSNSVNYGGREIDRVITTLLKPLLMKEILFGKLKHGGNATVDVENDKMIIKNDEIPV